MRGFFGLTILILSCMVFASTAEAQLLNRLKNKAKNAVENKVEQKIDAEIQKAAERMVEKSWNRIFGDGFNESGGAGTPFTLNSNAKTEGSYTFNVITTMEVENIQKNGQKEGPMLMHMHFSEEGMYSGTKFSGDQMEGDEGDIFIIYDLKNEAMVMLMENEDEKFSFAYDWKQAQQYMEEYAETEQDTESEMAEDEWENFEYIGTKTIAGLECRGYKAENEDHNSEYWVTNEENFGIQNALRVNSNTKQLKGKVPEDYPLGMMMEMTFEDLRNGETTTMRVTDINKNAGVHYNMADYPAMSFGGNK